MPTSMAELLDLPSNNPATFSQLDKANGSVTKKPRRYIPTHGKCAPPPEQVISSDYKSTLIREFEKFQLRKATGNQHMHPFGSAPGKRPLVHYPDTRPSKQARTYGAAPLASGMWPS